MPLCHRRQEICMDNKGEASASQHSRLMFVWNLSWKMFEFVDYASAGASVVSVSAVSAASASAFAAASAAFLSATF